MLPNEPLGKSLLAAGWRQGTLFELPEATHYWNDVSDAGEERRIEGKHRNVKISERLILISQDCDIVSDKEKLVEALLVRVKGKESDRKYLASILNSYREFVLDSDRGLVVDARVRLQIAKSALSLAVPDPWITGGQTLNDFLDWLAGRYDRPPVPDAIHEAVCRPVRKVIEKMRDEEPLAFAALDRSVRRLRIRLPPEEFSAVDVGLILVIADDVDEEGANAIERTIDLIKRAVADIDPTCRLNIDSILYGTMLLQEYEATRPIDLDYMTDQGREIVLPPIVAGSIAEAVAAEGIRWTRRRTEILTAADEPLHGSQSSE